MLIKNVTTEFTRRYSENMERTIIAFANSSGGKLFIGMDNDGTVCGVNDVDDTMIKVTNAVRDAIRPDVTMFIHCDCELIDNKAVIIITVQRGTARPYYLSGKGIRPEGVFVRQGSSTVPATESAILNMIKETSGDRFEDAVLLNQQLTFNKADEVFENRKILFDDAQKRTLGLVNESGLYTNLALLLSDQCPYSIKLAVFEGSVKTIFKNRAELSGSLLSQVEGSYEFIDMHNHIRAEFKGLERIDIRDYPPEAVREALLNAVVHRDYSFSSTLIRIFDDRIEFVNIGGLVKGISYDDIMLGISLLRNKKLADIFYRLNFIETYGTGIMKMMSSYEEYLVKPDIEVSDNIFKVTLPNINYSDNSNMKISATAEEDKILQIFRNRDVVTRKDVESEFNISKSTALRILSSLDKKALLQKKRSWQRCQLYAEK